MRIFNRVFCLLTVCLFIFVSVIPVGAASPTAVIAFSSNSLSVNSTLTVTVSFSADSVGAVDATLSYDNTILEFVSGNDASGGGGLVRIAGYATSQVKSLRYTLTFKALKAGSSTIRIESSSVYSWDEQLLGNPTAGANVTVRDASLSQNANLKSLSLSAGSLSPRFSAGTTKYTATVGNNVTSVNISAVAADSNAKVRIDGDAALKVGSNTRTITVTAAGGTVKTYTVTITRKDVGEETTSTTATTPAGTVKIPWNGKDYLAAAFDDASLPGGYSAGTARYRDTEIPAAFSENMKICIVRLTPADGDDETAVLCIYDDGADTVCDKYLPLETAGGRYLIRTAAETLPGFTAAAKEINGTTYDVWTFADESRQDFLVIRAINPNGREDWYCYDTEENTAQRYIPADTPAPQTTAAPDTPTEPLPVSAFVMQIPQWSLIAAVVLLALVCTALAILLGLSRRKPKAPETQHAAPKKEAHVPKH